jgi:Predicted membrane protein/domain
MRLAHHAFFESASLTRRLAAVIYDSLLLFAVLFVGTFPVLGLTDGQAVAPKNFLFTLYLLTLGFVFFGWFWTHGGQTLGMRAWRIRVQQCDGTPITWRQAAVRFCCAILSWLPLGAGFLWMLVDRDRLTWHDRCSDTRVIRVREPGAFLTH